MIGAGGGSVPCPPPLPPPQPPSPFPQSSPRDSPQGPPHGEPKVEKGCPKGQSPQNVHFFTKSHILAPKPHFAIFCSKTAFWAPKAPTPYKRNGFLALFGAIWHRKLKMSKIMHFNDSWDLLRYFAFLGPKVEKERKVEFRDQKNPHEPLCFACFLSQRHHLWCLCPLFSFFSVLGVKIRHLMKFHNFSVLGLKMRNEHFCDFEQKYTPETITFIRF